MKNEKNEKVEFSKYFNLHIQIGLITTFIVIKTYIFMLILATYVLFVSGADITGVEVYGVNLLRGVFMVSAVEITLLLLGLFEPSIKLLFKRIKEIRGDLNEIN